MTWTSFWPGSETASFAITARTTAGTAQNTAEDIASSVALDAMAEAWTLPENMLSGGQLAQRQCLEQQLLELQNNDSNAKG